MIITRNPMRNTLMLLVNRRMRMPTMQAIRIMSIVIQ